MNDCRAAALLLTVALFCSTKAQSDPIAGAVSNVASLGLSAFRLEKGPIDISGATDNCSGLAYSPVTKTIFVAVNNPPLLIEITLEGKTLRKIVLEGFDDTEDVAWIKGDQMAVVEERRRKLCTFRLPAGAHSVAYAKAVQWLVDPVDADNVGIEGLAWDAEGGHFFVVKEKTPRKIYMVTPTAGRAPIITQPWDIEQQSLSCDDLSGVYCHAGTGHLLVLSDESKCVVECTPDGVEKDRLSLKAGESGLASSLKQPEGITMDSAGRLYICSEPNQLYVFSRVK